jgi:hypothetical protein
MCSTRGDGLPARRIAPFGYPRLIAWLPLPEAFRRQPAPFVGPAGQGIHRAPIIARSRARPSHPPKAGPGRSSQGWHATIRCHAPRARTLHSCVSFARLSMYSVSSPTVAGRPPCLPGVGGATGVRTPNLRRARAALSRLSYGPRRARVAACPPRRGDACRTAARWWVGAPGLEPGASALSGPRSDRLSYAPPPPRTRGAIEARWGVGGRDASSSSRGRTRCVPAAPVAAAPRRRRPMPGGTARSGRGCAAARSSPAGLDLVACPHRLFPRGGAGLPRKEVIQPQLPLRLPCYDFVPVTRPALGRCPPRGLAHGLQASPAPVT